MFQCLMGQLNNDSEFHHKVLLKTKMLFTCSESREKTPEQCLKFV